MRDAVGTPLLLAASTLLRTKLEWAADHAPPLVRLSCESLWGGSRSAFCRMHQALSPTCAASDSAPRTHIIPPPFGLGATLNRRRLRNGRPSCRKDHRPENFAPSLTLGVAERSCGEEIDAPSMYRSLKLNCIVRTTRQDGTIHGRQIVDGQKGVTRAFRPRSIRKLWGICRSSNPSGISGCRREAVSRDKTTSHVSLSPPCMTTAGAKCRVPADIGTTSDAETLDTGRQGAISPAQRTCGPPLALFAARMPGSFDVESCQTNASFPPREFTRLSTYLLGNSPHMHACPDLIQTRSSAVGPVISHRQGLPVQTRNREKDKDKNSMFLVPTFPTANTHSTVRKRQDWGPGCRTGMSKGQDDIAVDCVIMPCGHRQARAKARPESFSFGSGWVFLSHQGPPRDGFAGRAACPAEAMCLGGSGGASEWGEACSVSCRQTRVYGCVRSMCCIMRIKCSNRYRK